MRRVFLLLAVALFSYGVIGQTTTQGSLHAVSKKGVELGACPLKTTSVRADISGFIARVNVRQEFENSFAEAIEAVYTFPLSQNGAVDRMTMTVGERVIHGRVMKREEARQVYESAKAEGKTASLLDQERPNIFTQSVVNIMPGDKVVIEISYVETLKYEDGAYEFVFPMTVGPRYVPGSVKDANKIKPPVAETRAGHDISVEVSLNAGVPVEEIRSTSHAIEQINLSSSNAKISLKGEKTVPNKDFILRYDVTGKRIEDGVIAHRSERGGFFTLILQPPDKIASESRTPKEIVFVLDTSGSMSGFPIEKAKEAMKLSLDGLYPDDTFNLITFSGDTHVLFDEPVPATQANIEVAQAFLQSRQGGGGTEMMKAIKAALDPSDSNTHVRIACFMTDGFVGNDNEIVAEIQRHPNARVFAFGIGSSVNRSLLERMTEAGKGEIEYVALNDDGSKAAKKFYERIRSPLLTDLSIEWNGMPVVDIQPQKLGDLFSAKPVIVNGRYTKSGKGIIKLRGKLAGQPYEREIGLVLPEKEPANDSLASLWARQLINDFSSKALNAKESEKLNRQITDIALEFRLITQFTSFVAVEERIVNQNGRPVRIEVPVEIPEGVDINKAVPAGQRVVLTWGTASARPAVYGNVFSPAKVISQGAGSNVLSRMSAGGTGTGYGSGRGNGSGEGSGSANDSPLRRLQIITSLQISPVTSSGVANGRAISLPKPQYSDMAKANAVIGSVAVYVSIDEKGTVVSAQAVSGNEFLRETAVNAAKTAKFMPPQLSGKSVRTEALITYNFAEPVDDTRTTATVGNLAVATVGSAPITEEMFREWRIKQKAHTWIFDVIQRLEKNTPQSENEALFVHDGKAHVRVVFKNASGDFKTKLLNLFFEPEMETPNSITGAIPIEKLAELCELEELKIVYPKT